MIHVAQIKFGNSSRTYDYICDIPAVKKGDVVQIEGKFTPVTVYNVADIEPKPNIVYKRVLELLKENENVSFLTRYMNVIDSDCDCIVNSLGPNTSIFGSICKSIVTAAESEEITKMLKEHPKANEYDIFVTDAGKLKAKKIIHIVMPYKNADDPYANNLRRAFSLAIDKAISLGMKSIAIPGIGTGASGFDRKDIYKAIDDCIYKYMYTPNINIEIQTLTYGKTIEDEVIRAPRIASDHIRRSSDIMGSAALPKVTPYQLLSSPNPNDIEKSIQTLINEKYKPEKALKIIKDNYYTFDTAYSYIDLYRDEYGKEKIKDIKQFFSKNDPSNFRTGEKALKKYDVIQLSFAIGLNFTQTIQFMKIAGFSFSSVFEEDVEVFKYIVRFDGFTKGIIHGIEYFSTKCKKSIYEKIIPKRAQAYA